jgi:hypothetical protein
VTAFRELTPLEVSSGLLLPAQRRPPRRPALEPGTTPRAAFDRALLPALRRTPCVISFSGGRDSSAVLAAATRLARREGLDPPVPATHRFPHAAKTTESDWQERVVRHLGLREWLRIEVTTELDCLGPVATAVLRRHGVLWPCNAYFHQPLMEAAVGGSLLTGVGGDEAFGESHWARAAAVVGGRVRPTPRDALRVSFALAPPPVKVQVLRRRMPDLWPWLRPAARRQVADWLVAEISREPLRRRRRYRRLLGSPAVEAGLASLAVLARDADVHVFHPFFDPRFLAALAAKPRSRSRSDAMGEHFGDVLPAEVLRRSTKARFDEVLWAGDSRRFVEDWQGEGVDPDLVDVEWLRTDWRSAEPDTQTVTLLQSAWLTRDRAAGRQLQPVTTTRAAG